MKNRKLFIKRVVFFLCIGVLISAYLSYKIFCYWKIPQRFFNQPNIYPQNNIDIQSSSLGKYYISLIYKAKPFIEEDVVSLVDKEGIRVLNYGGDIGLQYTPVAVSQYALGNYELYLNTKDEKYKEIFLKQADWLVRNEITTNKGFGIWEYKFDWKPYNIKAPWISAMAQGQAISVLLRAYQLTGDERYFSAAKRALGAFDVDIEMGGVKTVDIDGLIWYEEYPSDPPSHVLNGFIFALLGIYDFYRVTNDAHILDLFNEGIKTLENRLVLYDTGYWTTYDLVIRDKNDTNYFLDPRISKNINPASYYNILKELASGVYHNIHITQLEILYKITSKNIFKDYAEKWAFYKNNPFSHLKMIFYIILNKMRNKFK